MKIAVVGSGIAGLTAANLLSREHEVTLFEANDYLGGHTNTVSVREGDRDIPVDTGFIVFNDWTYPNFIKLMDLLGVASQPTSMSFSLRCEKSGLEYNGTSLNRLFAQRRNLFRPRFLRMLFDIVRFNHDARGLLGAEPELTVGDYLNRRRFSSEFVENYLIPVSAAIWSSQPAQIARFPIRFFTSFLHNHGMLSVYNRPQWRVIQGGSNQYVKRIVRPFAERIRLKSPVTRIRRNQSGVYLQTPRGEDSERFDQVVIAAHSDQALRMLEKPTGAERDVLGSIAYQPNETVLHCDPGLLPRNRKAWACWNYHLMGPAQPEVRVTYHSNQLQRLQASRQYCVTLNRTDDIHPSLLLRRFLYHHPIYSVEALKAQARHVQISGLNRVHYCGAYWGYGFHEDGVNSALQVCRSFGVSLQ